MNYLKEHIMTLNTRTAHTHPKYSPIDYDGVLLTNAQCHMVHVSSPVTMNSSWRKCKTSACSQHYRKKAHILGIIFLIQSILIINFLFTRRVLFVNSIFETNWINGECQHTVSVDCLIRWGVISSILYKDRRELVIDSLTYCTNAQRYHLCTLYVGCVGAIHTRGDSVVFPPWEYCTNQTHSMGEMKESRQSYWDCFCLLKWLPSRVAYQRYDNSS